MATCAPCAMCLQQLDSVASAGAVLHSAALLLLLLLRSLNKTCKSLSESAQCPKERPVFP